MGKESRLPWRIEAFREYLSYETLQPAAAVLSMFEGEEFNVKNPRIIKMQRLLEKRTNKDKWIPNRAGSETINWNIEGDVTRNKGRVFTSMLILYPKEWVENRIKLTPFGHALAKGAIAQSEYYDFIISRFQYPHPAWRDNWESWSKSEKSLKPFVYILQVLLELHKQDPGMASLNTDEIADYLHPNPDHKSVNKFAKSIIDARKKGAPSLTKRSDDIHRKISDLIGFLCLTRYCYFDGNDIRLNLVDKHSTELTNYYMKRKGESKLQHLESLIETSLSKD